MNDITALTPEVARESGNILIIVAARMARREFFTPLHALCEPGKRVVSTRALSDAVERAEERMVSQVSKIVDAHDRLTKKLKDAESRNAELVEALEKAQRANTAQDDHISQQQDRIDTLEKRNAELGREVIHLQALKTVNTARQEAESEFHRGYSCGHKDASLESRTVTVKLPALNDDLIAILGRPNFMCAHLAELLRKSGEEIKRKSEHEQATIIHWFLGIYLEHGDKWESVAKADIQARAAGIQVIEGEQENG